MNVHMPLVGPPDYEYLSRGPWFVSHSYEERSQGWIMYTLEAAIARFWMGDGTTSIRRVVVDALGAPILSTLIGDGGTTAKMTGTREMMEATLHLVRRSPLAPEYELDVLGLVERVRELGGHAL